MFVLLLRSYPIVPSQPLCNKDSCQRYFSNSPIPTSRNNSVGVTVENRRSTTPLYSSGQKLHLSSRLINLLTDFLSDNRTLTLSYFWIGYCRKSFLLKKSNCNHLFGKKSHFSLMLLVAFSDLSASGGIQILHVFNFKWEKKIWRDQTRPLNANLDRAAIHRDGYSEVL